MSERLSAHRILIGALDVTVTAMGSAAIAQDAALGPIPVEGGLVQGVPSDTEGVTAFLGVPYAGNVGGENRWRPAPPVEPSEGVLIEDKFGPQMLQDHDPRTAFWSTTMGWSSPHHGHGRHELD